MIVRLILNASGGYVCVVNWLSRLTTQIAARHLQICSQNQRERERQRVSLLQEQGRCPCHMRGSHGSARLSLVILVIACGIGQPQTQDCHSRGHHLRNTYPLVPHLYSCYFLSSVPLQTAKMIEENRNNTPFSFSVAVAKLCR